MDQVLCSSFLSPICLGNVSEANITLELEFLRSSGLCNSISLCIDKTWFTIPDIIKTRQKSLQNNWLPKFYNKKLCNKSSQRYTSYNFPQNSLPLRVSPSKIILSPRLGASIQNYSKSQKLLSQRFTSYNFPQNSLPLRVSPSKIILSPRNCYHKDLLALVSYKKAQNNFFTVEQRREEKLAVQQRRDQTGWMRRQRRRTSLCF